jgi:hypothetical protein
MKTQSKLRWAGAGAIWLVAILLLYSAYRCMGEIGEQRASNERLRSDARFRRQEAQRLASVLRLRDELVLSVHSVPLGLIAVRSDLERFASGQDVRLTTLDADQGQSSTDQISCNLVARGPLKGLLKLLAAIDQRPFLQPVGVQLKVPPRSGEALLEVHLKLHYQIRPPLVSTDMAGTAVATGGGAP